MKQADFRFPGPLTVLYRASLSSRLIIFCLLAVLAAACSPDAGREAGQGSVHDPVAAGAGKSSTAAPVAHAVASAHPLATRAGIGILQAGGNAFDAAVAVTAVLAVVEPYSSGLGGGGFYLLFDASERRHVMVDARETAPLAARRDMYLDVNGEVIPGASVDGPLSAGIPGIPAALQHLSGRYGALPLKQSLAPAIRYAEEGFLTDPHYQRMAAFRQQALNASADAARIFLRDGMAPEAGTRIVQTDLANTLQRIAAKGADGFYRGEIGDRLIASVSEHGGIWRHEDFESYRVREREPVYGEYRGMRIVSAPPPSSGGIAILQMLNMLDLFETGNLSEAQRIHLTVEAMRRAYRDRAEYLGDSDFVDVPVQRLISKEWARRTASDIKLGEATPSDRLEAIPTGGDKAADTTHFSIIDRDGNRVAATLSINYPFGSGFVAEGTGVLLNDEMDDFSAKPGVPNVYGLIGAEANAIEPGKRMLSSMTPTLLETPDRVAVLGTPGGSRIITMVLLAALDFHAGGDAGSMVETGRYHHQYRPDELYYEPGVFSEEMVERLSAMGHEPVAEFRRWGNMQALVLDRETGRLDAASDSRGIGAAVISE